MTSTARHFRPLTLVILACACPSEPATTPVQAPLFAPSPAPSSPAAAAGGPDSAPFRFVDAAAEMGILARHHAGRSPRRSMPEIMGGGVVLDDFDRNGALDVVFIDSGSLSGPAPTGTSSRLFLGDGHGGFRDHTGTWGLRVDGYGMGATSADLDGDSFPDLIVTRWGATDLVFRNEEGKGFREKGAEWGLSGDGGWSTSVATFDLENDGDLDLYVTRYVRFDPAVATTCYFHAEPVYCTPLLYEGLPDRLFRNDGGAFTDISVASGVANEAGKGLAVGAADIDADGDVDLYVANDTGRNFLFRNDAGTLVDIGGLSGAGYSELGREEASMGVDFADADEDGLLDIAVTNFQAENTAVYEQEPGLHFRELSDRLGIGGPSRQRLKFGIDFFDADSDGDEDLLVANGHIYDNVTRFRSGVTFEQPNTLYENRGKGEFVDQSERSGPALLDRQVSRGLATGDLDQDGDLDFVVHNNDGTLQVGRNNGPQGAYVNLWLEGAAANRLAIGARIEAKVGGRTLVRQVTGGESYLSRSDRRIHLGLGKGGVVEELRIFWPGDPEAQVVGPLDAGRFYHLVQGQAPAAYEPGKFGR